MDAAGEAGKTPTPLHLPAAAATEALRQGSAHEADLRTGNAQAGEADAVELCKKDDDAMGRASLLRGGTCAGVGMGGVPGPRAEGPDQVLPQKSQEDAKGRLPLFPMEASSI